MNCFLRPKTYHDTPWAHPFLRVVDHGCSIMISLLGCIPTQPVPDRPLLKEFWLLRPQDQLFAMTTTMIDTDTHGTAHSQTHKEQPTAGDTEKHQKKKKRKTRGDTQTRKLDRGDDNEPTNQERPSQHADTLQQCRGRTEMA